MADRRWKRPERLYNAQKQKAKARGIEWKLDFDEWWKIWRDSGKWGERGNRRGQFVMARRGDVGPYSVENVVIMEAGQNGSEALMNWPEKKKIREAKEAQVCDCSTVHVDVVVEKPETVIPVEAFKVAAPMFEEIFVEQPKNNFPNKQKHWTFTKIVCLMFPSWGLRWFAPNK